jgi:hypothetical protein
LFYSAFLIISISIVDDSLLVYSFSLLQPFNKMLIF